MIRDTSDFPIDRDRSLIILLEILYFREFRILRRELQHYPPPNWLKLIFEMLFQ